ncbi:MAG TPA: cation-translocating P-type ATPase [Patescibacteria group bacterium]|nr:cation-translocating P-type ATPase [Patescibacteria group bacterium]
MDTGEIEKQGLSTKHAQELLKIHGLNEIREKRDFTLFTAFFSQFDNFLIILLIGAGIVSFLFGEKIDSFFIFFIVILNAFFGVYQEFKAEKAIQALKVLTISTTRVIRDGREQNIDNKYLVPGDIIYVEEGAKIPADCHVVKARHFEVNESSFTGESFPVRKNENKNNNLLYLGTVVAKGRAYARVTKIGMHTRFGEIAQTLKTIKEKKTPLQRKLEVFSKQVGIIGICASIVVFFLSFIQTKTLFESFLFAVSLAVAAVPEGLPAVMTITLAIGVERMSKKKAIIRKLNAIETLGAVTLVATDKTGTLTTNQMSVRKIWIDKNVYEAKTPSSISPDHPFNLFLLNSILCSTASIVMKVNHGAFDVVGDTTEGALLLFAHKMNYSPAGIRKEWTILDEMSFNPVTKRMSVAVSSLKNPHEMYVFSKGAPESIIGICDKIIWRGQEIEFDTEKKTLIEKEFQSFAKKGLRTIAFSYKKKDRNLQSKQVFLGFAGIADPVRDEAREAVERAKKAGIRVVMITGDSTLTAEAIGIEAGIITQGDDILTGSQIDASSDRELRPILDKVKIYARTTPEHKYRLVKLLQENNVVAVTGDGVNDALALKQADVGVAMGKTGTDVAKEAADMIITDDNFATLINAIEEGRNIFNNIKNAIKYLLTSNTAEVIAVLITVSLKLPIVITALQILYINLITDGLPALSLAFSPKDKDIMRQKPRKAEALLQKKDFKYILVIGLFGGILTIISFFVGMGFDGVGFARTMAFTTLTLIQPFILLDLWLSHRIIIRHFNLLKHPVFLSSLLLPFLIQPFLIYQPLLQDIFKTQSLNPLYIVIAFLLTTLIILPIEIKKILMRKTVTS